jgi:hypothetical protein
MSKVRQRCGRIQNFLSPLLFLGVFLAACSGSLPSYTTIDDLRVLTLKAEPPDVSAGATLTVTPLISDVNGAGRTLQYSAVGCLDPGLLYGAEATCEGSATLVTLASATSFTLSSPAYTEAGPSISVPIPTTVAIRRSTADLYNGVAYLFVYTVTAPDGKTVKAVKRLIASTRTTRNSNPVLSDIVTDASVSLGSTLPGAEVTLKASHAAGVQESYDLMRVDGTKVDVTEKVITTWFLSDGTMAIKATLEGETNVFTPPTTKPTAHSTVIVGVTRDGRGGVDFKVQSLQ